MPMDCKNGTIRLVAIHSVVIGDPAEPHPVATYDGEGGPVIKKTSLQVPPGAQFELSDGNEAQRLVDIGAARFLLTDEETGPIDFSRFEKYPRPINPEKWSDWKRLSIPGTRSAATDQFNDLFDKYAVASSSPLTVRDLVNLIVKVAIANGEPGFPSAKQTGTLADGRNSVRIVLMDTRIWVSTRPRREAKVIVHKANAANKRVEQYREAVSNGLVSVEVLREIEEEASDLVRKASIARANLASLPKEKSAETIADEVVTDLRKLAGKAARAGAVVYVNSFKADSGIARNGTQVVTEVAAVASEIVAEMVTVETAQNYGEFDEIHPESGQIFGREAGRIVGDAIAANEGEIEYRWSDFLNHQSNDDRGLALKDVSGHFKEIICSCLGVGIKQQKNNDLKGIYSRWKNARNWEGLPEGYPLTKIMREYWHFMEVNTLADELYRRVLLDKGS